MKSSGILLVPEDFNMGQHITSINELGPQDIFSLKKRFKYTHKKSFMLYTSQKEFYPRDEYHHSNSVVGGIIKKREHLL